jgi:hypothetical protein
MKKILLIGVFLLIFLAGCLVGWLLLSKTTIPNYNCTNQTNYSIVYVEKECVQDTVYLIKECKDLTKADYRVYWDSVLEERQEELASNPVTEVRPANYVAHCDRAGVVC